MDGESGEAQQRELAARRKDLEREFDAKARELKAQSERRADKLRDDRAEWEDYKRKQSKDLADRAEALRRQEVNAQAEAKRNVETRQDLGATKKQVADLEQTRQAAAAVQADLERKATEAHKRLSAAKPLLAAFGGLSVLAPLAWLAFSWRTAGTPANGVAVVALVFGLVLNVWRLRVVRKLAKAGAP